MRFREPCPVLGAKSDSMYGRVSAAGHAGPLGRADESYVASDIKAMPPMTTVLKAFMKILCRDPCAVLMIEGSNGMRRPIRLDLIRPFK